MTIRLNCDIGESFGPWTMGDDQLLMPYVDMANIACGFHASDPLVMQRTVALAVEHEVKIGAHPGYPDLQGFGRRSMNCSADEIYAMVQYQVGALQAIAKAQGARVEYVKPHGAMYNDMTADERLFDAVLRAIADLGEGMRLVVLATEDNQQNREQARQHGVSLWFEGFADRAYDDNGRLRSRNRADAVYQYNQKILDQVEAFAKKRPISSINGEPLDITIDTLCVHGDNPKSVETVKAIRSLIDEINNESSE
ncbi:hypothetical protein CWI84_01630 [Idiomarina tyrosinivorans]|uniref:5-oxoprolinase subunit A n=1 Tax=Idiomarina tyrosinivorans TaxID=1445662 RepID=A0A432ZUC1_9GAMM|nr:5-oxoprolinase subunit PxpA [Idiomarina tyrosinivorans]RUO81483.1 hypothetical protein CWI84_01630 [Idiomarina tyrosinivorans]